MRTERIALLVALIVTASPAFAQAQAQGGGGGGGKGGSGSGNVKPSDAIHDVVTGTFVSVSQDLGDDELEFLDADLKALSDGKVLLWQKRSQQSKPGEEPGTKLYDLANSYAPKKNISAPACAANADVKQTYLFHVTHWRNVGDDPKKDIPPRLVSSNWYVYRRPRHGWWNIKKSPNDLVKSDLTGAGDPLIYGASRALIVSIDRFDPIQTPGTKKPAPTYGKLASTYSVTVTQGTPQNLTNLGSLVSALGGISAAFMGFVPDTHDLYVAVSCQEGTKKLPFDMSVTDAVVQNAQIDPKQGGAPQTPNPGTVACTGMGNTTPCAMNRTFTSQDREYWDVSLGLAIPGVRETRYSFSSASNTVSSSVTTHTELYAFLDLFPFAALTPKESWTPHINLGIPVTSKSLYRPYFGIAENLTSWIHLQKRLGLPVGINFFVGMTFMKTQQIVGAPPTTQTEFNSALRINRVWKPMFGIEVPVGALASKLGGKSKK
jgi:hypothetical protein